MPDDALFAAAKDGKLNSPDDVAREARRLLASDKAKVGLQDFYRSSGWRLAKLATWPRPPTFTDYTPALAQAMVQETRDFVSQLFFGAGATGKLEDTADLATSTVDGGLAKLYGVTGVTGRVPRPSTSTPPSAPASSPGPAS